jgi:hypothetical protein
VGNVQVGPTRHLKARVAGQDDSGAVIGLASTGTSSNIDRQIARIEHCFDGTLF